MPRSWIPAVIAICTSILALQSLTGHALQIVLSNSFDDSACVSAQQCSSAGFVSAWQLFPSASRFDFRLQDSVFKSGPAYINRPFSLQPLSATGTATFVCANATNSNCMLCDATEGNNCTSLSVSRLIFVSASKKTDFPIRSLLEITSATGTITDCSFVGFNAQYIVHSGTGGVNVSDSSFVRNTATAMIQIGLLDEASSVEGCSFTGNFATTVIYAGDSGQTAGAKLISLRGLTLVNNALGFSYITGGVSQGSLLTLSGPVEIANVFSFNNSYVDNSEIFATLTFWTFGALAMDNCTADARIDVWYAESVSVARSNLLTVKLFTPVTQSTTLFFTNCAFRGTLDANADPTGDVVTLIVRNSTFDGIRGGLLSNVQALTVTGCLFRRNSVASLIVYQATQGQITDNVFIDNTGGSGLALLSSKLDTFTISNLAFINNTQAAGGLGGGGLLISGYSSDASFSNLKCINNEAQLGAFLF